MKRLFSVLAATLLILLPKGTDACTNILVTRGASADGSNMVSYSADSHTRFGFLQFTPGGIFAQGSTRDIIQWGARKHLGNIPQVERTYTTVGNMNEHQLIIGESTWGGRAELEDPNGGIDYGSMMYIALERTKTAREAIQLMVDLANEHGYYSSGESISIADKEEVWILEIVGKGVKMVDGKNINKGVVWVAVRIPDGYVSSHANQARIRQFPLNDPENCIYAPDVITFAREKGYFKGKDKDFSFTEAYAPADFGAYRYCEARVWSAFNYMNSTMGKHIDYAMGQNPNNPMPLYIKPDKKISVADVANMMRDHYEGTEMDMTKDVGAGGEESPYRSRPMSFEVDGKTYLNERAIATQQTGFWFIGQSRAWLPDVIGGLNWFGVDDAATSPLAPIYTSITRIPETLSIDNGSMLEYSPTSMFWLVNRIAQFSYLRYNTVGKEVRETAEDFEKNTYEQIKQIDKIALSILTESPEMAVEYLTDYSVNKSIELFELWENLDNHLLVKYIDGNVKQMKDGKFIDNGNGRNVPARLIQPGYSEVWKRAVAETTGDRLLIK